MAAPTGAVSSLFILFNCSILAAFPLIRSWVAATQPCLSSLGINPGHGRSARLWHRRTLPNGNEPCLLLQGPKMVPGLPRRENWCVIFNLFKSSSAASYGAEFRKSLTMVILCLEYQTCREMDLDMPAVIELSKSQINSSIPSLNHNVDLLLDVIYELKLVKWVVLHL